ncbi:PAS domain-containing methyl-accepting chemotaxis protein [Falsiroseomonas selenitidurans]|uniref:PAS domain S-box protein n=1 Tax=Falsiroseomonas selenitidurans TaxID=2716335 RepID=A0ABX1E7Y0_9PROT|nr:PAS domain-containing methyl-accepting chemotaxis protein [Falsiroseomonas selenitidurans]NKC33021.1 PAS domain S-box protein [Falsiroseomonas selenitidurans]
MSLIRPSKPPAYPALEALRTCVMVADSSLTIRYVNAAARRLMQEAEAELQAELPGFSAARLVGSNIDVFHKDPRHQRGMLKALQKPHAATIRVGRRVFDLLVTPLVEKDRHDGFVVEWADAQARLQNVDYAGQIAAIGRNLAVVELGLDGTILTANEKFLQLMGYTLAEVRGRQHGIFVEPAQRDGADYRLFWEKLRRGDFQSGQFRRIGKAGQLVWIEGAYNPILDATGKPCKVVKFATDISPQMRLLSDLKTLIDRNFAEVDSGIARSTSEAASASGAADEAAQGVQQVAASAEQLAASISEIARSMAQSRIATDAAFEQTVSVASNTESLAGAAQAMSNIVGLIRDVASQINLLALNATIEAARAGEAGKGFAVVASEVKNLAVQAAQATQQISAEIDGIQATSASVAEALGAIRSAVTTVRESVTATASAVEEQSVVTRGMSASMHTASAAVTTVSANIAGISAAIAQAARAVSKTREAAEVLVR